MSLVLDNVGVYSLTNEGRERAQSILERIKSTPVQKEGQTVLLERC